MEVSEHNSKQMCEETMHKVIKFWNKEEEEAWRAFSRECQGVMQVPLWLFHVRSFTLSSFLSQICLHQYRHMHRKCDENIVITPQDHITTHCILQDIWEPRKKYDSTSLNCLTQGSTHGRMQTRLLMIYGLRPLDSTSSAVRMFCAPALWWGKSLTTFNLASIDYRQPHRARICHTPR